LPDLGIHPLGIDEGNRCRKPVVMAIRGQCYTIGFELLLDRTGTGHRGSHCTGRKIAKAAPLGVMGALKSARIAKIEGEKPALERLIPDFQPLMASEDVKEGIMSFLERREAVYTGK
jgi:enoyl-CoA hydratase/carnithine racemase